MTKFRTLVGDALRFHDTTHDALRAAVRLATRDDEMADLGTDTTMDDWSPEARAAAAASRKAHAHVGQQASVKYGPHEGKSGEVRQVEKRPTFSQMVPHKSYHHIKTAAGEYIIAPSESVKIHKPK